MLYLKEKARWRHVLSVGSALREADATEAVAATGLPPLEAVVQSWRASTETFVVLDDTLPVGVGGVLTFPDIGAVPWLVGTPRMTQRWGEFARRSAEYMRILRTRYPLMTNFVSTHNTVHVRWLQWLGCEFGETVTINNTPFVRFTYV